MGTIWFMASGRRKNRSPSGEGGKLKKKKWRKPLDPMGPGRRVEVVVDPIQGKGKGHKEKGGEKGEFFDAIWRKKDGRRFPKIGQKKKGGLNTWGGKKKKKTKHNRSISK